MIWVGDTNGISIRWTTSDLYVRSKSQVERLFAPLVRKGFEAYVDILSEGDTHDQRVNPEGCEYEREFRVLSVVGTLVSFEDRYSSFCGGAHPELNTRFTTVDLTKSGELQYARGDETPMTDVNLLEPGKVVKLTDYFDEKDILDALLADPLVKRAFAEQDDAPAPRTLEDIPRAFASNYYELGDSGYELRPDFLTRFAFHHLEGNKVAIRLGLPPHYGANDALHLQLGLLLPIPTGMRQQLSLAAERQQGFLMKDAPRIANGRATSLTAKGN